MTVAVPPPRPRRAVAVAGIILAAGTVGAVLALDELTRPAAFAVLLVAGAASNLLASTFSGTFTFSPALIVFALAAGLLGPAEAFAVAVFAELVAWLVERYRWRALLINLAGTATPTVAIAWAITAAAPAEGSTGFYLALGAAAAAFGILNWLIVVPLFATLDGLPLGPRLVAFAELLPTVGIGMLLTLVVAGAYVEFGAIALTLLVVVIAAVAYMTSLVASSREQTRQYANLSWGILSALIRTLNERDHRAARHCAAVAMFSRDIAHTVGLGEREAELAHTAGLLHDIGKFVLSDRVMERGAQLDETDWRGIRRHPDIGADLLRDIGVFGPVGEIIRCHHERIDGRGYPRGLTGEQIPEVAKIVAVAEVYDTLTAPDTYRTPMNSFEALNELRRVSGSQLDAHYVEALSELLAGRGTEYRHQDEADFDRELDMERRLSEAAAPA